MSGGGRRLEQMRSEWRLAANGRGTSVRYRYEGSAGGSLPRWLAKIGREARTRAVLEGLAGEVRRRAPAESSSPGGAQSGSATCRSCLPRLAPLNRRISVVGAFSSPS
jgi:hypothetical protein